MNQRTVNEFVEDLVSDGRTEKEIFSIAQSTHWKNKTDEVKDALFRLERRRSKLKRKYANNNN